jgi:superfamily II DNA or RNA helicase
MLIEVEKLSEVYCQIKADSSQFLELREFTSFYVPNYRFHPKFKARIWDGKVSYYDARKNLFPIGCLPELKRFCDKFSYGLKISPNVIMNHKKYGDSELLEYYPTVLKDGMSPRDYQHDAVKACLNNRRGVALSATGSGKSLIQYLIIRKLLEEDNKVLLIVPSISLVGQMYSDFRDYGWSDIEDGVECLHGGLKPTYKKQVLITTYQSLLNKETPFFEQYTAVINDECHGVRSVELQNIGKKCINANTRLGFTGTIPREPSEFFNVHAMIGPVVFEQKSKELMERGLLSGITVVNTVLKYPQYVLKESKGRNYHDEVNLIETTGIRNKFFGYLFKNLPDNQNTLILVNHIEHLKEIERYLETNIDDKYQLYVIHGQISAELREEIRQVTDKSSNVIILASYGTMSTGVSIRKLHNVVFGSSCKSEIRVLQSIGRGLRLHESKSKMILWDMVDDFTRVTRTGNIDKNHVYKHWEFRTKYYKEQGFDCLKKTINLEEL